MGRSKSATAVEAPTAVVPPVIEFSKEHVLELVRTAPRIGRIVTTRMVAEAGSRSRSPGRLLASAAIYGVANTNASDGVALTPPRGMSTYLQHQAAGSKAPKLTQLGHDEFAELIHIVGDYDTRLNQWLEPTHDRSFRLGQLYDGSNTMRGAGDNRVPHPILEAVPPFTDFTDRSPLQGPAREADRLLRFILLESMGISLVPDDEDRVA